MIYYYKLEGQIPVAVESAIDWNLWMAGATFADVTVMYNEFNDCLISTKFTGIDLNPGSSNSKSQPMVFETLVIGGALDGKKNLYPTWDEAIQGHLKICVQVFKLSTRRIPRDDRS
ncbi:hypothetical protein [Nostoc sp.]|uniref:hypothetical protein n=1 Tax=Nostoc sp. TaxID=1180 RepID=UPI002FF4CB35